MSPIIYTNRDKTSMKNTEMNLIKHRIDKLPYGSVFVISDFTDISSYENAKKCLLRLEKTKKIRRIIRGIYDKPYFSSLINESSSPDMSKVANAIARNYNWQISPTGLTSLNLLGLSTQVTNKYEYFSSGQYKTYDIGKFNISFKHKSSKELINLSYKSSLVVQAIKELGSDINEEIIQKIKRMLSKEEKAILLRETGNVTKWIFEVVKRITNESQD